MAKAIIFSQFGGPDVLQLTEVPEPHAGPGEVRVRVHAVGINPLESQIRVGAMEAVFPTTFPSVPGLELAGVVNEVGEGVTTLAVGDEVLGWGAGSYAELVVTGAEQLALKPAAINWEEAAALPVAGETAARGLDALHVVSGETVLIHGASGAVGSVAVQLAVARGATVIGTASAANQEYVRGLGATPVVYGEGLVERVRAVASSGIDAALDAAGYDAIEPSIELTGGTERVATIADAPGSAQFGVPFLAGAATPPASSLGEALGLIEARALRLTVAQTFPFAQAADAQTASVEGHLPGKLVLVL